MGGGGVRTPCPPLGSHIFIIRYHHLVAYARVLLAHLSCHVRIWFSSVIVMKDICLAFRATIGPPTNHYHRPANETPFKSQNHKQTQANVSFWEDIMFKCITCNLLHISKRILSLYACKVVL